MPLEFSAGEVLEMACQIERNGARFYRKAAEAAPDEARRRKLLDLAAMEEEHLATFTGMARALSERERTTPVYDPDNLAGQYLRALADARVFDVSADPAAQLTGGESLESVLLTAIQLEKDSIVFYVGMCEMVPQELGRDTVRAVITEEMQHVVTLTGQLSSLS